MGIQTLSAGPSSYGLSLALGSGEVRLLDLVTAYHTIANRGRYMTPRFILSMSDNRGQAMLENGPESVQVISEDAAFLVTDILSDDNAASAHLQTRRSHLA